MPSFPKSALPDLAPWRDSRDFRVLWWSGLSAGLGHGLTAVALPFQLAQLTGSPAAVGLIGVVQLVPLVVFGLYGGALADAADQRRLILWAEAGLAAVAGLLVVNALLPTPPVWPLYAAAALNSALAGLQRPATSALVPRVVAHRHLPAAAALTSLRWQCGAIVGPSIAGLVVAWADVGAAYALNALACVLAVLTARRLAPSPARGDAQPVSLRGIAEGAGYAWRRKELLGTYAVDVLATFFAFPIILYPFLAEDLGATWALGLMYAALPVGSALVGLSSGWTTRVHRHGRAVAWAAAATGAAVALAGWAAGTGQLWLVLLFLTLTGCCDMVSGIFRRTIWDQSVPDALRGRLAGIELLSYSGGPQLGQLRAGTMAGLTSVRTSVWAGGLLCVAGVGLLVLCLPRLLAYDARTNAHTRAVREERAAAAGQQGSDTAA
ncbi:MULTISPECIES: MFS transporter [unclassified Streptomyces]|uniref:MFS transporter n=1 Tax=unclassified Streptomyces TaxID=2593676 RepID=UPI0022B6D5D9|nr:MULTISPECIES: MFS transporter [unclassified Streptomyces]MCZ7413997.1 MFS transporter [Streptomyces sp. WMMC897]MCZ7430992.1 MFS transporter [Streptomyces sp. WMMC1477]